MLIVFVILISQPSLHEGWPVPVIKHSYDAQFGGPKTVDINGDGEKEILFAGGNSSLGGILYAFSVDGTQPPGWPIYTGEAPLRFISSPAIGDIDGDGTVEILIGSASDGTETGLIYAYNLDGTMVDGFPILAPEGLSIRMPITLALIDQDSIPDILVTFNHYTGTSLSDQIGIINPLTGEFLQGWPVSQFWFSSRPIYWNDGKITAYIGNETENDSGYVITWGIFGDVLPGWPQQIPGSPGLCSPGIADIDNDNQFELISPWDGTFPPDNISFMNLFEYNGTQLPGYPVNLPQESLHAPPAVADIDLDDTLEIIQNGLFSLLIFEPNGEFTYIYSDIMQYDGEPAIADVDGDEQLEIVLGRSDYVENDSSFVNAFRLDGSQPEGWPLFVIGQPIGTPLIDDLDGDGLLEMVVFTEDLPWVRPDTGWLYLFDLPAPFDSARVPWGQYAHDLWNSGIYGFNPPVSVAEKPPLQIPTTYQVVYRNGIPELIFTLSHPQTLQLNLYDVTGRMLWRNVSRYPSGTHRLRLSGTIPSGVHILKLRGDQTQTLKVIKLR